MLHSSQHDNIAGAGINAQAAANQEEHILIVSVVVTYPHLRWHAAGKGKVCGLVATGFATQARSCVVDG